MVVAQSKVLAREAPIIRKAQTILYQLMSLLRKELKTRVLHIHPGHISQISLLNLTIRNSLIKHLLYIKGKLKQIEILIKEVTIRRLN